MMSYSLNHFLLLVLLVSSKTVLLVMASNNASGCGNDVCCQKMEKLMAAVSEINIKLDEQARQQKSLKADMSAGLASTTAISTQFTRRTSELLQHDARLQAHIKSAGNADQLLQSIYGADLGPRDCSDIRAMGYNVSGIYRIYPGNDNRRIATDVFCDFSLSTESWLVFQQRRDGSRDFYRTFREYENGFGNLNGEFWLGNEKLSLITTTRRYKLRIEMMDFQGEKRYAVYSTFSVRPATEKYRLYVGGYSGNAGDSFTYHNNMMFSTKDQDNDGSSSHCAQLYPGGWWFNNCYYYSNLNGVYLGGSHTHAYRGIYWYGWRGIYYSYKATEMKITAY